MNYYEFLNGFNMLLKKKIYKLQNIAKFCKIFQKILLNFAILNFEKASVNEQKILRAIIILFFKTLSMTLVMILAFIFHEKIFFIEFVHGMLKI